MSNFEEKYEWIDDKLNKTFKYKSSLKSSAIYDMAIASEELSLWYLKSLKDDGKSNAEIATIVDRIFYEIQNKEQLNKGEDEPEWDSFKLRATSSPNLNKEAWCGYNPNDFSATDIFEGIVRDVYIQTVINPKETISDLWLKEFFETEPEAYLREQSKHVEIRAAFEEGEENKENEEYTELLSVIESIGEEDENIEKWLVKFFHSNITFITFLKDYWKFRNFITILKINMTKENKKKLSAIIKAIITSDPTTNYLDDKDILRILGKNSNSKNLKELAEKYYEKAKNKWRNVKFYYPSLFSLDTKVENKDEIAMLEAISSGQANELQDTSSVVLSERKEEIKERSYNLQRRDCLFGLFDVITQALNVLTGVESSEYWLGKDKDRILNVCVSDEDETKKFESTVEDFEVVASKDNLILLLNPEDYRDLNRGITKNNQMDSKTVKLDMLDLIYVYPVNEMKAGYARLVDKRALRILSYIEKSNLLAPKEDWNWRYEIDYRFDINIFRNFGGCLFIPDFPFATAS